MQCVKEVGIDTIQYKRLQKIFQGIVGKTLANTCQYLLHNFAIQYSMSSVIISTAYSVVSLLMVNCLLHLAYLIKQ